MKTFDEYWEQYGELHASMCGGDIKQFAKEIWESAIFKAEADYIEEHAKVVRLETELAEARAEIERLTVLLTFPSYQMYCPYRASIKIC